MAVSCRKNKVTLLKAQEQASAVLKERLWYRYFHVLWYELLQDDIFTEYLRETATESHAFVLKMVHGKD